MVKFDPTKVNLNSVKGYQLNKNVEQKKAEETKEEVRVVEQKKAEADGLNALGLQNLAFLKKTNVSDKATAKRIEEGFKTFLPELDKAFGIENEMDFASFAMANIRGVDPDKMAKHMNKDVSESTKAVLPGLVDRMTV